jgi:hypothetical protein
MLVGDTVGATEAGVADWTVALGVGAMTTALPAFATGGWPSEFVATKQKTERPTPATPAAASVPTVLVMRTG